MAGGRDAVNRGKLEWVKGIDPQRSRLRRSASREEGEWRRRRRLERVKGIEPSS